jgi:hypothetical protein
MSDANLLTQLESQLKVRRERHATRLEKSYDEIDPTLLSRADRGDYLALELTIYRELADIQWLERSIALLKRVMAAESRPVKRQSRGKRQ